MEYKAPGEIQASMGEWERTLAQFIITLSKSNHNSDDGGYMSDGWDQISTDSIQKQYNQQYFGLANKIQTHMNQNPGYQSYRFNIKYLYAETVWEWLKAELQKRGFVVSFKEGYTSDIWASTYYRYMLCFNPMINIESQPPPIDL